MYTCPPEGAPQQWRPRVNKGALGDDGDPPSALRITYAKSKPARGAPGGGPARAPLPPVPSYSSDRAMSDAGGAPGYSREYSAYDDRRTDYDDRRGDDFQSAGNLLVNPQPIGRLHLLVVDADFSGLNRLLPLRPGMLGKARAQPGIESRIDFIRLNRVLNLSGVRTCGSNRRVRSLTVGRRHFKSVIIRWQRLCTFAISWRH